MPLYEYQCRKCKHKFEKIQKFSDKPIRKCPECGGPVEKLTSLSAVQFKGSGWYKTDYASRPSSPADSASGDAGAAASGAEPKPEAKSPDSKASPSADAPAKETKKPAKKK